MLSIFILAHLLKFCMTVFSFVFFIFFKSIFAMGIFNVKIPYCFCANLTLLPSIFVPLFFLFHFSSFFSFIVCITMFLLSKVHAMQSLVMILFYMRQASILRATFLKACFFIFSIETLLLNFSIILFFLLQKKGRVFALAAIVSQIWG